MWPVTTRRQQPRDQEPAVEPEGDPQRSFDRLPIDSFLEQDRHDHRDKHVGRTERDPDRRMPTPAQNEEQ